MSSLLTLQSVTSGYTRAPILRDVSIEVGANETVAVLGANGAGKSTLLRTIMGALKCWEGTISMDERDISRLRPWHRVKLGLGHVPENRRVFGAMSVDENLAVGRLAGRTGTGAASDVYEIFPRLAERRNQVAGTLSGGEQQMLAIARALMTRPRVLLIDEMSAGLAPTIIQNLVEALVRVRAAGMGVLVVEQSPHVIAGIVDRVYLLEQGRVVNHGSLDEVGGADAIADLYLGVH